MHWQCMRGHHSHSTGQQIVQTVAPNICVKSMKGFRLESKGMHAPINQAPHIRVVVGVLHGGSWNATRETQRMLLGAWHIFSPPPPGGCHSPLWKTSPSLWPAGSVSHCAPHPGCAPRTSRSVTPETYKNMKEKWLQRRQQGAHPTRGGGSRPKIQSVTSQKLVIQPPAGGHG